jgi:hypothetical protein
MMDPKYEAVLRYYEARVLQITADRTQDGIAPYLTSEIKTSQDPALVGLRREIITMIRATTETCSFTPAQVYGLLLPGETMSQLTQ